MRKTYAQGSFGLFSKEVGDETWMQTAGRRVPSRVNERPVLARPKLENASPTVHAVLAEFKPEQKTDRTRAEPG